MCYNEYSIYNQTLPWFEKMKDHVFVVLIFNTNFKNFLTI